MAFLGLTAAGARESVALATQLGAAIWVNVDTLANDEVSRLRQQGLSLTRFTYFVDPSSPEAIADAVSTIREHHPGESVWVEGFDAP